MVDQFLAFFADELMEITAYVMMVMNIKAWDETHWGSESGDLNPLLSMENVWLF